MKTKPLLKNILIILCLILVILGFYSIKIDEVILFEKTFIPIMFVIQYRDISNIVDEIIKTWKKVSKQYH